MTTHGVYDPILVALSVGVAMFASFTALNLTGRLKAADGSARAWWLLAAAMALGGGIWSMHFIGMLAFALPVRVSYDIRLTAVSLVLPVVATGLGLFASCRGGARGLPLLVGGAFVGMAIVAMHYTGMAAMQMPGAVMTLRPLFVAVSVAIAVAAAAAALWLAFRTEGLGQRLAASLVMGAAISGMHYTGMAAAMFHIDRHAQPAADAATIQPGALAVAVAGATGVILLLTLMTAYFDRKLATLTAHEAKALRRSEERYRSLIEGGSDIIAIVDRQGAFAYESSSALNLLGYTSRELLGRKLADLVPDDRGGEIDMFLDAAADASGASVTIEMPLLHAAGTWRDFEIVARDLRDQPAVGGIVVNMRDITERRQLMARLEVLSETDLLTGILNRRGFLKFAEREFERMRRAGCKITVVMFDIDHFKAVNDTFGHAAGDLVLAMIADECRKQIREVDLLARMGGEEFAIVLADSPPETVRDVLTRLREAVARQTVSTIRGDVSVTASFGMAVVDPRHVDAEAALRYADEALYEAKNAGRNCIKMRA